MHNVVFRRPAHALALLLALVLAGGALAAPPAPADGQPTGTLRFLESWPEGTSLDSPSIPEAFMVWPRVLAGAKDSLAVSSFYFSRKGDGQDASGPDSAADRLLASTEALKEAAERGVQVHVLGDAKFQKNYPEFLAEMQEQTGAESRAIDLGPLWGGVMHAKYFLVDDHIFYVGSQNWDWRAMSQIRELGVLIDEKHLAAQLAAIFAMDWEIAGGATVAPAAAPKQGFADLDPVLLTAPEGQTVSAWLAASPRNGLPAGVAWDLPLLVEMIDSAEQSVRLQLLSYNVSDRQGNYFADLDNALRGAAARGVQVEMLISNWSKVGYKLHWLQSLAAVRNITVKFSNIPELDAGFIPFARVEHTKYMVVDGQAAWVGTSNWSADYFHASRNVSLFFAGQGAARPLAAFFARGWNSPYTETLDPCGEYAPPRRN